MASPQLENGFTRIANELLEAFIPHPATWLNGRRWEDEVQGRTRNGRAMETDDPRWPHVWQCDTCGEVHEGTKAQWGHCLKGTESQGERHV